MSETTHTDDRRTEPKRITEDVNVDDLIIGDRIDKRLVALNFGQLGHRVKRSDSEDDPEPKTQLVSITAIDRVDDTHHSLLADPDTGTIIRATRHKSESAWSQKEQDWTVHEIGSTVTVDVVHDLQLPSGDDTPDDDMEYVQGWAEVVIEYPANGFDNYSDKITMTQAVNSGGQDIELRDIDGRVAHATISLK